MATKQKPKKHSYMYFTKGYLIMHGSLTTKLFLKSRKGRGLYALGNLRTCIIFLSSSIVEIQNDILMHCGSSL